MGLAGPPESEREGRGLAGPVQEHARGRGVPGEAVFVRLVVAGAAVQRELPGLLERAVPAQAGLGLEGLDRGPGIGREARLELGGGEMGAQGPQGFPAELEMPEIGPGVAQRAFGAPAQGGPVDLEAGSAVPKKPGTSHALKESKPCQTRETPSLVPAKSKSPEDRQGKAGAKQQESEKQKAQKAQFDQAERKAESIRGSEDPEAELKEIELWRALAKKGNPFAQERLGSSLLESGWGEEGEGPEWLKKAALQGFAPAQRKLGEFLLEGGEGESRKAEGAQWLKKAHENGDPEAHSILTARLMAEALGPAGKKEAERLLREAGEAGDGNARIELGALLADGRGGAERISEGIAILEREAGQAGGASAEAKWRLAEIHMRQARQKESKREFEHKKKGMPSEKQSGQSQQERDSQAKALKWLDAAASDGHYHAQIGMGALSGFGDGSFPRDEKKSAYWLGEAHKNPNRKKTDDKAMQMLEELAENGSAPAKQTLAKLRAEERQAERKGRR